MITRRELLQCTAALAIGAVGRSVAQAAQPLVAQARDLSESKREAKALGYTPVVTPNGSTLPWKMVDGVKVYHLIAEEVKREIAPGLVLDCWGYNGQTPGPTIEAVEGDRVRIYVTNKLPEPTTVHWHGIILPNGMDGVSGLNQKRIEPGETFKYEFTLRQHGTQMYHPHFDEMVQMGLGMMGMFVIHPRKTRRVDRDFAIMLNEWFVLPGASRANPQMMDFNLFTFNSRVFPGTDPMVVKLGDRVRIRIGNLSAMDNHPIHLHGYSFKITATDGGPIAESAQWPEVTVIVPVGSTRDIEFVADNPGDWAFHCHMTHHLMNQMGHDGANTIGTNSMDVDMKIQKFIPGYMSMGQNGMGGMAEMGMPVPRNSIPMQGGPGPFGTIDMGGMMAILKVRENLASYDADPGWYLHKKGELAAPASSEEIRADLGANPS